MGAKCSIAVSDSAHKKTNNAIEYNGVIFKDVFLVNPWLIK